MKRYRYLFLLIGALALFVLGSLVGNIMTLIISSIKFNLPSNTTQTILLYIQYYFDERVLEDGMSYAQKAQEFFNANPDYFEYGKFLSAFLQLMSYGPLVIFIIIFLWKDLYEDACKLGKSFLRNLAIAGIGFASMLCLSFILSFIYQIFGVSGTSENESILQLMMQGSGKWLLLIAVVIFAPLCEEIIFRKLLIDTCEKSLNLKPAIAIAISSFIFALIHVTDCASFVFIFQYLALAVPLCLVYHYSNNNIYVSILVHMANNLLVGIGYLIEYGI